MTSLLIDISNTLPTSEEQATLEKQLPRLRLENPSLLIGNGPSSSSPQKSPGLKRSGSSSTAPETPCPSDHSEGQIEENEDGSVVCLKQQQKSNHSSSLVGPCLVFGEELQAARSNPAQTKFFFESFIERSTRHDIRQLRDLLSQEDRIWESVTLVDRAFASNFRRWAYKKDNICHHIEKICERRGIQLDFQVHLELNVDDLPLSVVLALLHEVQKHPEIRNLSVVGHLNGSQVQTVMDAVTLLVSNIQEDRTWQAVNVYIGHVRGASDSEDDYETWRSIMEHAMMEFAQLYSTQGLPIDIRPCATS